MMPVDETENEIRVRVRDPGEFARLVQIFPNDQTLNSYPYNKMGIRGVGGPLKSDGGTEVQAYIFSKRDRWDWTPETAEAWVRDQGETPKGYSDPLEPIEVTVDAEIAIIKTMKEIKEEDRVEVPKGVPVVYIEGAASTDEVDREGESIEQPSISTEEYERNPVLCSDHNLRLPIGTVTSIEKNVPLVKEGTLWRKAKEDEKPEARGLWIKAAIIGATQKAKEVLAQVQAGIVRALSVRGQARAKRKVCHVGEGCHNVLSGLNLIEISIVPVPANQGTLFSIAKSLIELQDVADSLNSPASVSGGEPGETQKMKEDKNMSEQNEKAEPAEPETPVKQEDGEMPPDVLQRLEAVEAWGAVIEDLIQRVDALEASEAGSEEMSAEETSGEEKSQDEEPEAPAEPAPAGKVEPGVKKSLNPSASKKPSNAVGIAVEKDLEASKKIAEAAWRKKNRIEE